MLTILWFCPRAFGSFDHPDREDLERSFEHAEQHGGRLHSQQNYHFEYYHQILATFHFA